MSSGQAREWSGERAKPSYEERIRNQKDWAAKGLGTVAKDRGSREDVSGSAAKDLVYGGSIRDGFI